MATRYKSYTGRILTVDLTSGKAGEYDVTDTDRELFLGGKFLSTKILFDLLKPGIDPMSSDNIIVVMTSPLTGTGAPSSSRYDISAKSPLTGTIGHSNSGGNFGINLKKAGWDGLIITGASKKPVYLEILDDKVAIKDAKNLWGLDTQESQKKMLNGRKGGAMTIGVAGENLVKFASIVSEERSHGRGGMGTVMGTKKLKGAVVIGTKRPELAEPEKFKKTIKKWTQILRNHPATGDITPKYGTAAFLMGLSRSNTLPTKNFTSGTYEDAHLISGEYLAENYLVKNDGCLSCPIRCARVVEINGENVKGPEYEILCLLGSNILNNDIEKIIQWNYELDLLGMDSISSGTTLGFAMELNEKGLWKNGLEFGKTTNISDILNKMAHQEGIGKELSQGVKWLSEKYGGKDFAPHSKGLEIPGYSPRSTVGQGMGYAVAPRGACHLDAGYTVYFEVTGPVILDQFHEKSKPPYVVLNQNLFGAVSSGGNCLFTAWPIIPGPAYRVPNSKVMTKIFTFLLTHSGGMIKSLVTMSPSLQSFHMPGLPHTKAIEQATGMKMTFGKYAQVGARGYTLDKLFNIREGFGVKDDTLASRFTDTELLDRESRSVVKLNRMIPAYYKIRGWDKDGIPTKKTLRKMSLEFAQPVVDSRV